MAVKTIAFPNYTQIPSRLSISAWRAVRAVIAFYQGD